MAENQNVLEAPLRGKSNSQTPPMEPPTKMLAGSCFDFLLIELVPTVFRIAESQITYNETGKNDASGSIDQSDSPNSTENKDIDRNISRERVNFAYCNLERIGYRVGFGLAERFTRGLPPFSDTLDVIKFICKDFWMVLYRKQIDNLKTNHRGVYVLTDNTFRPISRISHESSPNAASLALLKDRADPTLVQPRSESQVLAQTQAFLPVHAGIIKGALAALNIKNVVVFAETMELPSAVFQIKINSS